MVEKVKARTDDPAGQPRTDGGQVESLAALGAEAAALVQGEQAAASAVVEKQAAVEERQAASAQEAAVRELAGVLCLMRDGAAEFADEAGALPREKTLAIWTDERLQRIAGPLILVADRHGGGLGELMEKYGPYVMLLAAAAMPTMATAKAVREHRATKPKTVEAASGGQQQPA